jgi:hypothetical protein
MKDRSTPEARKLRSLVAVVFALGATVGLARAEQPSGSDPAERHLGCGGRHAPCGSLRGSAFVFS